MLIILKKRQLMKKKILYIRVRDKRKEFKTLKFKKTRGNVKGNK